MPGRRMQDQAVDDTLCRRCQILEPTIVVRNEPLCKACFCKYVNGKVVKRMESFRVRHSEPGNQRRLLLPISRDACSVALLHVLNQHLAGQNEKTGRTGYGLYMLLVDDEASSDGTNAAFLEEIKTRYPEHTYHIMSLSEAFSTEDVSSLFPRESAVGDGDLTSHEHLLHVLNATKSATAKQDLEQILRRRLIVQHAKEQNCEAVIWQDSTTMLAQRTLAETAKGRGFSLAWLVADGESPHGIPFYFPLRELLTKEVEAYVSSIEPLFKSDLYVADRKPAVSTKNTTIDDLMKQYFETVEQDYPSIVANVVRTTSKLQTTELSQIEQQCELCNMPLQGRAPAKSRLCWGCIRTVPQVDT